MASIAFRIVNLFEISSLDTEENVELKLIDTVYGPHVFFVVLEMKSSRYEADTTKSP